MAPKKKTANKRRASRTRTRTPLLASLREWARRLLGRQADDVWGVVLIVAAILFVLGFVGQAGPVGRGLETGAGFLFGVWRYLVPVALAGIV